MHFQPLEDIAENLEESGSRHHNQDLLTRLRNVAPSMTSLMGGALRRTSAQLQRLTRSPSLEPGSLDSMDDDDGGDGVLAHSAQCQDTQSTICSCGEFVSLRPASQFVGEEEEEGETEKENENHRQRRMEKEERDEKEEHESGRVTFKITPRDTPPPPALKPQDSTMYPVAQAPGLFLRPPPRQAPKHPRAMPSSSPVLRVKNSPAPRRGTSGSIQEFSFRPITDQSRATPTLTTPSSGNGSRPSPLTVPAVRSAGSQESLLR